MKYVIHKTSRMPADVSYSGPTWDRAGIRNLRQDTYADKGVATQHARELTRYNPVGFTVSEVTE